VRPVRRLCHVHVTNGKNSELKNDQPLFSSGARGESILVRTARVIARIEAARSPRPIRRTTHAARRSRAPWRPQRGARSVPRRCWRAAKIKAASSVRLARARKGDGSGQSALVSYRHARDRAADANGLAETATHRWTFDGESSSLGAHGLAHEGAIRRARRPRNRRRIDELLRSCHTIVESRGVRVAGAAPAARPSAARGRALQLGGAWGMGAGARRIESSTRSKRESPSLRGRELSGTRLLVAEVIGLPSRSRFF